MSPDEPLTALLGEAALGRLTDQAWNTAGSEGGQERVHEDRAIMLALLNRLTTAEATLARVEALAEELAHPDTDLIVAFERAIHRNIARQLRAALASEGTT